MLNIFVVLVALLVVLSIYQWFLVKKGAKNIFGKQKAIYSDKLDYTEVDPSDFSWVDHNFYQEYTEKMIAEGFESIGDYECITLTKQFPNMRAFLRIFTGDAGTSAGCVYHVKMRGVMGFLALLRVVPKNIKAIEFQTEFEDGTFLSTNNLKGLNFLNQYPGVVSEQLDPGTRFESILFSHRVCLQGIREKRNVSPRQLLTRDSVLASSERLHELKSEHRRKVGYVTREEFNNIAGGGLTKEQSQLVNEFEKMRDEEKEQDDSGRVS